MITFLHISIALGSVAYIALLLFRPAKTTFMPAYLSLAATLGSGVLLMIMQPATIAHVCVSGSVYLVAAAAALVFASRRRTKLVSQ